MNSKQGRGAGRGEFGRPLKKPGRFREPEIENVTENDEKLPAKENLEQTVTEAGKSGRIELAQGLFCLLVPKFSCCFSVSFTQRQKARTVLLSQLLCFLYNNSYQVIKSVLFFGK